MRDPRVSHNRLSLLPPGALQLLASNLRPQAEFNDLVVLPKKCTVEIQATHQNITANDNTIVSRKPAILEFIYGS